MEDDRILKNREMANPSLKCNARPAHRILVVDDEQEILDLNVRTLRQAGYHVEAVSDGAAAWGKIQSEPYDLIITDNAMPKRTGIELIEDVRKSGRVIPVIMATGLVPEAQLARNPHCRPSAFLVKPYTATEFLSTVKNVLCSIV